MKRLPCFLALVCSSLAAQNPKPVWKFAVSGDSRNCGDIVMPAIASGVRASGAVFYWHLGDFRAIYRFDEDMLPPPELNLEPKQMGISDYQTRAWPDFIAHQLEPFGDLPVFLAPGNHETIPPATKSAYLAQFADWLTSPMLRAQRLKDDPKDHSLKAYFHWIDRGVDFISLDNSSHDQFDDAQLDWFRAVVRRDETSTEVHAIVVGMHAALPGSIGQSHSMSEWPLGEQSGRAVYETLWHAKDSGKKLVYILASHSHFFMEDVYRTDLWKDKVLPGWIVGTAGAVRYSLPPGVVPGPKAQPGVYGFMTATVMSDGTISFEFQPFEKVEVLLNANKGHYPEALVRWCFTKNK